MQVGRLSYRQREEGEDGSEEEQEELSSSLIAGSDSSGHLHHCLGYPEATGVNASDFHIKGLSE